MNHRILMVTQFYPPVAGGQEQYVRNLSHALAARGHAVSVATITSAGAEPRRDDGAVGIHPVRTSAQRMPGLFTSSRQFAPPVADPEAVWRLRRVIDEEQPDLIHAHDWLARSALPRAAHGGRPIVMTLHDYSSVCATKRLVYRESPCTGPGVRKCLACAADYYGALKGPPTAVGNWAGAAAERRGVRMFLPVSNAVAKGNGLERRRLPFRVIPNFVPDDIRSTANGGHPGLAKLPDRDFLLFVGDLARDKGIQVLLAAYGRLEDPPPLVLIGRPLVPVEDLPAGVVALGVLPAAAVMSAWRRAAIGVVPSIVPDSCPTVVIEAMAAGCPVVASRTGGIPDLIDPGETGILVRPADPVALAAALERLLASPGLRRAMGEAARAKVEEFTATRVVPRIEQVYRETLASGGWVP